jgi:hypothetical protein
MKTRLELLCEQLRATERLVITCTSRTQLSVRGHGIAALADEIRAWKPELLRGLFGARGAEPYACARCGCEVVTSADARCEWCAVSIARELEIHPRSAAETDFLARLIHNELPSQLSQAPKTALWDDSGRNDPRSQDAAA